jgi:hypothetical protein
MIFSIVDRGADIAAQPRNAKPNTPTNRVNNQPASSTSRSVARGNAVRQRAPKAASPACPCIILYRLIFSSGRRPLHMGIVLGIMGCRTD